MTRRRDTDEWGGSAPPGYTEEEVTPGPRPRALRADPPAPLVSMVEAIMDLDDELADLVDPEQLETAVELVRAMLARRGGGVPPRPVAIAVLDLIALRPWQRGSAARVMRALAELVAAREELLVADPAMFVRADALVTLTLLESPRGVG